jgi:hypothetical protein
MNYIPPANRYQFSICSLEDAIEGDNPVFFSSVYFAESALYATQRAPCETIALKFY